MTLYELSCMVGKQVCIRSRAHPALSLWKWCTSIDGVEVKSGRLLRSEFGGGDTPDGSAIQYAEKLRGQTIVVDAMRPTRREYLVPLSLEAF